MAEVHYTLASWLVREGEEEAFVKAWREDLASAFTAVAPSVHGTLVQSLDNPRLYYSFGAWDSLELIQAARSDPAGRAAIAKVIGLCEEAQPGTFRLVLTVP